MAKVAFIGLGNMGRPMAANLVRAGHELHVFDLSAKAMQELSALGARTACSSEQAVRDVDFVISMLPAGQHVKALYIGTDETAGLFSVLDHATLVIDSSTIDNASAQSLHQAASAQGIAMLDAPVSGGVAAAEAGTLSFMCGGEQDTFAKIKPLLEAMGKNIFHAGGAGAGQSAKVCNNMLLSILMLGTSEAIKLGIDHGLDPAVLSEIMLASSGRNWTLECYNPCPGVMATAPSSHDYQPGFMVDLMYKDLGLAMDAAQGSKSPVPMGALAHSIYSAHSANGNGRKDFSSVFADLARLVD